MVRHWQIEVGIKRVTHDDNETIDVHMRSEIEHRNPSVAKAAATKLAHKHSALGPTVKYETLTRINRWRNCGGWGFYEYRRNSLFLVNTLPIASTTIISEFGQLAQPFN